MRSVPGEGRSARSYGFTLIEVLVTLSVAAILTASAVPAFRSFLQNDRAMTQSSSLVLSLNIARSEAIKQDISAGVSVCPSTDGLTCSGASTWEQGWVVLGTAAASVPTEVVPSLSTGTTLREAANSTAVTFFSSGVVGAPAAFTLCDSRGASQGRYIQVTATGRVATAVGKDLSGHALVCP
jgi:type IV fimbrial biogenesis protein FimT